jgi:CheY-like chemotaxis protein
MMTDKSKIMVIDDEEAICIIVKLYLERTGKYDVISALTGEEGIRLAEEEGPDLILLDIYMPEMSGPEVLDRLSLNPATEAIPVVFLTGVVTSEDVEAGKGLIGGRRFIAKPITSKNLDAAIRSILKKNL